MYGVFFMSEVMELAGIEDQSIHLFADETAATQFVFDKLVDAGFIKMDGTVTVDGEACDSIHEAIDAVQMGFGITEFFHVYAVTNHCDAVAV